MDITEKLRGGPDGTEVGSTHHPSKVDIPINEATANSLAELRQTARLENGSNITFSTLTVGMALGTVDSLDPVGGPGPLMKAFGKVVKPQANVTAPWLGYNTTSLCPLVPPKLGEFIMTYCGILCITVLNMCTITVCFMIILDSLRVCGDIYLSDSTWCNYIILLSQYFVQSRYIFV